MYMQTTTVNTSKLIRDKTLNALNQAMLTEKPKLPTRHQYYLLRVKSVFWSLKYYIFLFVAQFLNWFELEACQGLQKFIPLNTKQLIYRKFVWVGISDPLYAMKEMYLNSIYNYVHKIKPRCEPKHLVPRKKNTLSLHSFYFENCKRSRLTFQTLQQPKFMNTFD